MPYSSDVPVWAPARGGQATDRVRYPGFPVTGSSTQYLIPGQCRVISVHPGDVLKFQAVDGLAHFSLTAIDSDNRVGLEALGLEDAAWPI